jgi:NADP-dependent 3-hydroxy acid dehydrogenase YdfG
VIRLDVQDRESIVQAIKAGIGRFGKIDALIDIAGVRGDDLAQSAGGGESGDGRIDLER